MDNRRLDTAQVLALGVLDMPKPVTDIPDDREEFDATGDDFEYLGHRAVAEALDAGKLVKAPNYYGIPYAWKSGDSAYQCRLMQYCSMTERLTHTTAADAAAWFESRYEATYG